MPRARRSPRARMRAAFGMGSSCAFSPIDHAISHRPDSVVYVFVHFGLWNCEPETNWGAQAPGVGVGLVGVRQPPMRVAGPRSVHFRNGNEGFRIGGRLGQYPSWKPENADLRMPLRERRKIGSIVRGGGGTSRCSVWRAIRSASGNCNRPAHRQFAACCSGGSGGRPFADGLGCHVPARECERMFGATPQGCFRCVLLQ
jgi:hypothetical protein